MKQIEFGPHNPIVRLCLEGMAREENGKPEEAGAIYLRAWEEANSDFEYYLAAFFMARIQKNVTDQIRWYEKSLEFALKIDDNAVKSALPTLYSRLAECSLDTNDPLSAAQYRASATFSRKPIEEEGPFYHGTKADLSVGDLLTPGFRSNYRADIRMNHIYFTTQIGPAGLAAALATGTGQERVYIVQPTGDFENDPNVTDKKFPGNPTRSYRTAAALEIIGEVSDWTKPTPEQIAQIRAQRSRNKGEIIN